MRRGWPQTSRPFREGRVQAQWLTMLRATLRPLAQAPPVCGAPRSTSKFDFPPPHQRPAGFGLQRCAALPAEVGRAARHHAAQVGKPENGDIVSIASSATEPRWNVRNATAIPARAPSRSICRSHIDTVPVICTLPSQYSLNSCGLLLGYAVDPASSRRNIGDIDGHEGPVGKKLADDVLR